MGLFLLIAGLVLGFGLVGYFIYSLFKLSKSHVIGQAESKLSKEDNTKHISILVGQSVCCILSSIGLVLVQKWNLSAGEYVLLILGSIILGAGFDALLAGFILYYWKTDLVKEQRKFCRITTFAAIGAVIIGIILLTEGFAQHINIYKGLPNGINFTKGLVYPGESTSGFTIKFYGILLVSGALISYFVCDHYFYKKFKKHGLIDTLFVFAFLCGLIGSRLWYCLILEPDKYLSNPVEILKIFNGGLAIQGGAIFGIIGGVSFVLLFRKYVDIRFAMDVAVPSILLAQVLGRWGNFFNQEVYGMVVSEQALYWLPTIIRNNMFINGQYRLPLFIIEGLINFGGYFFIRYFLGKVCKFKLGLGYQASFYLIWYGMVRVILEPLREGFTLNMGSSSAYGYMQSWIIAFAMMGAGLIMWLCFYLVHRYRFNKGLEDKYGERIKAN